MVRNIALVLGVVVLAAGCASVATAPSPSPGASGAGVTTVTIAQGTQGQVGTLSIGVFSIENVQGRLEGAIQILPSEPALRVHAGETVERAGYSIYVQELRIGSKLESLGCGGSAGCSGGDRITLVVTPPPK